MSQISDQPLWLCQRVGRKRNHSGSRTRETSMTSDWSVTWRRKVKRNFELLFQVSYPFSTKTSGGSAWSQTSSSWFDNQRIDSLNGRLVRERHQHFAGLEPRASWTGLSSPQDQLNLHNGYFKKTGNVQNQHGCQQRLAKPRANICKEKKSDVVVVLELLGKQMCIQMFALM